MLNKDHITNTMTRCATISTTSLTACLLVGSMLFFSGCDQANSQVQPPAGRVAIIDLDKIAKAVGKDTEISEEIRRGEQERLEQIKKMREDLTEQVDSLRAQISEDASEKQRRRVAQAMVNANRQMSDAVNYSKQATQRARIQLIGQFRRIVEPLARQVAKERGMSIVMVKQPGIIFYDPETDISNSVIDALLSQGMPALKLDDSRAQTSDDSDQLGAPDDNLPTAPGSSQNSP